MGNPTPSALVRLGRAATADDAVGSGAQVGIDVVDEWGHVRIIGKTLHDKISLGAADKYGIPKFLDHHGRLDKGRAEPAANAVWSVAMVAHGIVAPEAVIGALINLAVDDLIGLRRLLSARLAEQNSSAQ